jgi:hypothetical protein
MENRNYALVLALQNLEEAVTPILNVLNNYSIDIKTIENKLSMLGIRKTIRYQLKESPLHDEFKDGERWYLEWGKPEGKDDYRILVIHHSGNLITAKPLIESKREVRLLCCPHLALFIESMNLLIKDRISNGK